MPSMGPGSVQQRRGFGLPAPHQPAPHARQPQRPLPQPNLQCMHGGLGL